jgi:hypothetical protein
MTAKQPPLPKTRLAPPRDIHIRLPSEQVALLCQVAERECRSVRGQAEWFIRQALASYDARVPAPSPLRAERPPQEGE